MMKKYFIYFLRLFSSTNLIFKSTFQTGLIKIGISLLLRFYKDILFIFLLNKIRYNNINQSFNKFCAENYRLTYNWFGSNPEIWFYIFKKLDFLNKKLNILEIGTFEGRSAAFFYKYLDVNKLVTVDLMKKDSIEYGNFEYNSKKFINCDFYNLRSDIFFKETKLKQEFDIIYIDGSHFYADVLKDAISSYSILKSGGIIIFDDFLYTRQTRRFKRPEFMNVIGGILYFLNQKKLKLIYVGHQVIVQKI